MKRSPKLFILCPLVSKGFHDPAQFPQEIVSINRIEYSDGTIWQQ
jgi:hypothetical protein